MKSSLHSANLQNQSIPSKNDFSDGFCRAKQFSKMLAISDSTLWLWVQQKVVHGIPVPQPIRLSPGITVWKLSEVHAFYEQLANLGNDNPPEAA